MQVVVHSKHLYHRYSTLYLVSHRYISSVCSARLLSQDNKKAWISPRLFLVSLVYLKFPMGTTVIRVAALFIPLKYDRLIRYTFYGRLPLLRGRARPSAKAPCTRSPKRSYPKARVYAFYLFSCSYPYFAQNFIIYAICGK